MIRTRFPPEPNGYLHIGHLKAMHINFTFHPNCQCILRFDDTNPRTENEQLVDNIINDIKWLEYEPYRITYTSDYFDELYKLAITLIKKGMAYVDFSKTISEDRYNMVDSEWRETSVDTNLKEFDNMKKGIYKEGEAVLRLKIDMQSLNPNLRDPIAYRIIYKEHYRKKGWCIYATYDYSHCIVDSLEDITYSYCSMEFQNRREQYYKILDMLELKKPTVKEFNRLEIKNNVISKRKINEFIQKKHIDSFDDPRLMTICGLRNRGYTANALKQFVSKLGFSQNTGASTSHKMLDHYIRQDLDTTAVRRFAILDPIKITLTDFDDIIDLHRPDYPSKNEDGDKTIKFTKDIYIDRNDFREYSNKKFHRLSLNKKVRLKYGPIIECISVDKTDEEITGITAICIEDQTEKVKGCIQWLCEYDDAVFYQYDDLLIDNKYNENLMTIKKGMIEKDTYNGNYQFERVGYFRAVNNKEFIEIIPLRQDKGFKKLNF